MQFQYNNLSTDGNWQTENLIPYKGFNSHLEVKNRYVYSEKKWQPSLMNLCIVIDGARKNQGVEYNFRDGSSSFELIKQTATWFAKCSKKKTELVTCEWSGTVDWDEKVRSAKYLRDYLKSHNDYKSAYKICFAYQDGSNLLSALSTCMRIHTLVFFAFPRPIEVLFNPDKFDNFLYFYSDKPVEKSIKREFGDLVSQGILKPLSNVVRTNFKESPIQKASIGVVNCMARILSEPTELLRIRDGVNLFPLQSGKTMASIRVLMNGQNPEPINTIRALRYLPCVLEMLHNDYPYHFLTGSVFDLNMRENDDSVCLSVSPKETKKLKDMSYSYIAPTSFDRYKRTKNGCILMDEETQNILETYPQYELWLSSNNLDRFKNKKEMILNENSSDNNSEESEANPEEVREWLDNNFAEKNENTNKQKQEKSKVVESKDQEPALNKKGIFNRLVAESQQFFEQIKIQNTKKQHAKIIETKISILKKEKEQLFDERWESRKEIDKLSRESSRLKSDISRLAFDNLEIMKPKVFDFQKNTTNLSDPLSNTGTSIVIDPLNSGPGMFSNSSLNTASVSRNKKTNQSIKKTVINPYSPLSSTQKNKTTFDPLNQNSFLAHPSNPNQFLSGKYEDPLEKIKNQRQEMIDRMNEPLRRFEAQQKEMREKFESPTMKMIRETNDSLNNYSNNCAKINEKTVKLEKINEERSKLKLKEKELKRQEQHTRQELSGARDLKEECDKVFDKNASKNVFLRRQFNEKIKELEGKK